jgi:hypothetical protein
MKALTSVVSALSAIDYDDGELARFDRLTEHIRQHSGSLKAASEAIGEPVTCQVMAIVASGAAYNWFTGGAEAALSLPGSDDFEEEVAAGDPSHRDLVRLAMSALRDLAWARMAGQDDRFRDAGKCLLELVGVTLRVAPEKNTALDLALASHDLLAPSGDPDARVAQGLAYRLLVWSKNLPFLADLAPCKFPPPVAPRLPSETLLDLCLSFIENGILGQSIDLSKAACDMLDDPESVIWNDVVVEIGGKTERLRMEATFGPALLRWALDNDSKESKRFAVNANVKIRTLLQLLCENRMLLERHRDDDLSDVYICAYLGEDPTLQTMGLVMTTEIIEHVVRCGVGLSEDDTRVNSTRNQVFAPREAELIDHLKASIAADRYSS